MRKNCSIDPAAPQTVHCNIDVGNHDGSALTASPFTLIDTVTSPSSGVIYNGLDPGSTTINCAQGAGPYGTPINCTGNYALNNVNTASEFLSFNVPQGGTFTNCANVTQAGSPVESDMTNNRSCATVIVAPPIGFGHGTLDVSKKIEVIGSIQPPNPSVFMANVACLPGGPNVTLSLDNANGYHNTATGIATGAGCTVTEQAPVVPAEYARKGCHWETQYPNGQNFRIRDMRRNQANIVNVWSCKGDGGGKGTLDVIKKIEVVGSIQPPNPSVFMANVACHPGGPNVTLELSNDNGYQNTATGIATGAGCTVTEQAPAVPGDYARKGCHWETQYPSGQNFQISDLRRNRATIVNVWSCKGDGGGKGTLDVIKKIEVVGSIQPPNPSVFMANVACLPGGPNVNLSLDNANGYHNTATGIATGAHCTVTEQAPVVPAEYARKGCHWETQYPNGQNFPIGDLRRNQANIVNVWSCKGGGGGTLQIHKSVVNTLGVPTPTSFNMTATCSGMAQVAVTVPVNVTVTVPPTGQIPNGTVCTIAETPPPQLNGVKACPSGKASWVASNPGPLTIHAAQTTGTIITNTLVCDPPVAKECPDPSLHTIGCRGTVTIKRTKGPAIYSVLVSPAATAPTPNIAPSTSSSCVIAGGAMINQTTCWFNYNMNSTLVMLTATSSTGTLPPGFSWSGACSGSAATCNLTITPTPQSVIANFP